MHYLSSVLRSLAMFLFGPEVPDNLVNEFWVVRFHGYVDDENWRVVTDSNVHLGPFDDPAKARDVACKTFRLNQDEVLCSFRSPSAHHYVQTRLRHGNYD